MKIKCLLALLAVGFLVCVPARAQEETRHEIGVSYGVVPNSVWIDVLTDVVPAVFGYNYDNEKYVGPIGIEYYYHTSPLVGVGAVAVFAANNEDGFNKEKLSSHRFRSYSTLMPSVKFDWLRRNQWGLYSKVAMGATLAHFAEQDYDDNGRRTGERNSSNDLIFNFQASLIGVEAGGQHVRGFAELGVGEQGIILCGVRYKF